jgi:lysophosphatidylcholine acyltransferase/lyso-PAF acetyltransferase
MADGESEGKIPSNPWERIDLYGSMGLAPQPVLGRIRLALCAAVLVPIKMLGALVCLLSYFLVIKASRLFPASVRSDWVAGLGKIHCRACLFCLGFVRIEWIRVSRDGAPVPLETPSGPPAVGIVSNHSSWVDILIHMSHSFPSFVARDATKQTPIIGSIRCAAFPIVSPLFFLSNPPLFRPAAKPWGASTWTARSAPQTAVSRA